MAAEEQADWHKVGQANVIAKKIDLAPRKCCHSEVSSTLILPERAKLLTSARIVSFSRVTGKLR